MARTINEIKQEIASEFTSNSTVIEKYGLDTQKTFEEQFSKISIESILFYVVAYGIFILEKIFDTHKQEVITDLEALLPHTKNWYRNKVLRFQYPNRILLPDKDYYDNTGLTEDQIKELEVVKFCAVEDKLSELRLKVAQGEPGERTVLDPNMAAALYNYLCDICDCGVFIRIINQQSDRVFANIEVFYNPILINPADKIVENTFKEYISNLPFNGELARMRIEDTIQQLSGVELVEVKSISMQRADNEIEVLKVRAIAASGYWVVNDEADLIINYIPYASL